MHDIRALRTDPAGFDAAMARRGLGAQSDAILSLDSSRRATLGLLQETQAKRRELARDIGRTKREGGETDALEAQAVTLRVEMDLLQSQADDVDARIKAVLEALPNTLAAEVPPIWC
jgi:seryl-tRNA synthetase